MERIAGLAWFQSSKDFEELAASQADAAHPAESVPQGPGLVSKQGQTSWTNRLNRILNLQRLRGFGEDRRKDFAELSWRPCLQMCGSE